MITAVDTSVLLDVFGADPRFDQPVKGGVAAVSVRRPRHRVRRHHS
jgi:hypothetical protein